MATITNSGNYLLIQSGTKTNYINKPFDVTHTSEQITITSTLEQVVLTYSDITSPTSTDIADLVSIIAEYNNTNESINVNVDSLSQKGDIDSNNSTTTILNNNTTYTGIGTDVSGYSSIVVACKTDKSGLLYIEFSTDNTNWDSSLYYTVTANVNEVHRLTVTRKYFRVRFTNNSGENQTFFRLQSLKGYQPILTSNLNSTVQNDADATITRSVLMGETDGGIYTNVPVTYEGHLEVAIHEPLLPFGSIHTEKLTPVFQTDAVYGINSGQVTTVTSGSGTVTGDNNLFTCSTGTTIYSQSVLLGRKRLRYRAGQGVVGRFTALYSTPVANSYQIAGFGTASDGVYFGYGNTNDLNDTRFGILYVRGGVREVRTLTVTTGATSANSCIITLNGTAFSVPLTNASNIQRTVYEISTYTGYTGWDAFPASSTTVVFVRKSAGVANGVYSFTANGTGASATIAQTKAGVASTDTFIPQSEWNGDKLDGTGASGITLDPTKGNVYQINIQYLGFGAITFKVETSANGNNPTWVTVHVLNIPNTLTLPTFTNPSFPFLLASYSAGSTTDISVKTASMAGFIEGDKMLQGNRFSYFNQLTTVGATNLQALITVMNTRYYQGKANQAVINLLSVSGAIKHTSPVVYYLIKGGTLNGNPSFTSLASNSCSVYDTSATTVTYSSGDQLLWTGHLGDTGELDHPFGNGSYNAEELTLQPGEWVTLAAKSTTGNPQYVTGSINTREDQ